MSSTPLAHSPSVPASEVQPEFTLRAIVLGAVLGVVFGAASTFLALRVGLTTSASVPIAVLAIWAIRKRRGQRAILEHNIVQTTGSAGESVASAVVFTVPALIFLGYPLQVGLTALIAVTGGVLGVLMMVPLRRYLIVKEHGVLRYPEGKACAEILQAGERGGTSAKKVFVGLGFGALFKAFQALFGGVKASIAAPITFFRGAEVGCDVAPELLGVGYIIGYRTSVMMVAGSVLASLILVPLILLFGAGLDAPLAPATTLIRDMSPGAVWSNYVKHIGAGAVAAGGIFALARALPSIVSSIRASAGSLFGGAGGSAASTSRLDRDTPVAVLLAGALAIVVFIWFVPAFQMTLLGALLILVLGFLFSVVSSRITGEVGSSSCPLSGMTIGVLMATCGAFLLAGWEGSSYSRLALMIGAVVCIAISNAGTCSQDLKTGFLVGATPVKQQGALLIGVLTSVLAVGWTAYLLNLAETREHVLAKPFAVAPALVAKAESSGRAEEDVYALVALEGANAPAEASAGTYLVDRGTNEARYALPATAGAEPRALPVPFAVAPALVEAAKETAVVPDAREYAFVRLAQEDVPSGVAPGIYLVDRETNEARVQREDGIGAGRLQAPQAKLMSVVIDGLLTHKLPWDLILIGAAIAVFIELLGFRSLTFAVGVYLPISSTMPVFLGGVVRFLADKLYKREPDAEDEPQGVLWCSGLIAGASILGILAAMQGFLPGFDRDTGLHPQIAVFTAWLPELSGSDLFGLGVLALLGFLMYRGAAPAKE
ncbi:MAG: oligopeptide transporter, OPT family [Planctomycetes bacterium]|nr:oligopeptide transporter, OPT family [Planctomycetota bacterium]